VNGGDGDAKPRRFGPPDSVVVLVVTNSAHVSAGDLAEAEQVATDESESVDHRERRTAMTIRTQLRRRTEPQSQRGAAGADSADNPGSVHYGRPLIQTIAFNA
jgi:hypothetical protein